MAHADIELLRAELAEVAVEQDAAPMAAYMKDHFLFLGVKAGPRRIAQREFVGGFFGADGDTLVEAAEELWAEPEREFAYVGCDLLRRWNSQLGPDHLVPVRRLVQTGSWWDTVDALAVRVVGPLVRRHRELQLVMDEWVSDEDFWVARTAILHQLLWKDDTDTERLARYCELQQDNPEFFIRKAIGWALRHYARTDPDWVRQFVDTHPGLSSLSRREATKHL